MNININVFIYEVIIKWNPLYSNFAYNNDWNIFCNGYIKNAVGIIYK